jgi:hypothetical protein
MEPGAGDGAIIRAVNAVRSDVTWTAVELREECVHPLAEALGGWEMGGRDRVVTGDFLTADPGSPAARPQLTADGQFAVVLGNPPFPLAIPFVERSLELAHIVALLLSTGILGSGERADWWPTHVADQLVIPDRISFTGKGSDTTTCAWFVWYRDQLCRPWGRYRVLPHTGAAERAEDRGQLKLLAVPPLVK